MFVECRHCTLLGLQWEIDFICANFDYIQACGYKPGFLSIILPDQFDTAPVFGNEALGLLDSTGL